VNTTTDLAQIVRDFSFTNLLYCGYAANRDVMWGDGGMARFYADNRYHYSKLFGEKGNALAPIPQVLCIAIHLLRQPPQ